MEDLIDWSDSPAKTSPTPPPNKGPAKPNAFDFLAKPANGPNYHSTGPLHSAGPAFPSQQPSPQLRALNSQKQTKSGSTTPLPRSPPPPAPVHDAFSSLLGINGSSSASSSTTHLSLAQRQTQAVKQKQKRAEAEKAAYDVHDSFWDNLGSSSKPGPTNVDDAFGGILLPTASAPVARPISVRPAIVESSWDNDDLLSGGTGATSVPQASSSVSSSRVPSPVDPFDLDHLSSATNHLAVKSQPNGSSGMRTPLSDFDFAEREEEGSDEDILGDLGWPAKPLSEVSPVS